MPIAKPTQSGKMVADKGDATMTARYINPYTDFGFKKLFREEASKDLLIDFLNSILPQDRQIADIEFHGLEKQGAIKESRKAVFDVHCTAKGSGERFIVEMQKAEQHYFQDRALFYSTFAIQEQAVRGNWDFQLNAVYFVAILDFVYDKDEDRKKFFREVSLKDQDGEEFYDKYYQYFFQMPLFNTPLLELKTQRDKWFYFLRNLESFTDIPAILQEPVFERAFAAAARCNLSIEESRQYEADLKVYRDNYAVMKTAVDQGRAEGEAIGEARGRAEGKAERDQIVRNMKQEGLDTDLIVRMTGLSKKEIDSL